MSHLQYMAYFSDTLPADFRGADDSILDTTPWTLEQKIENRTAKPTIRECSNGKKLKSIESFGQNLSDSWVYS